MRKLWVTTFAMLWLAPQAFALDGDKALSFLSSQQKSMKNKQGALVRSYTGIKRAFLYDQALSAMAHTHAGKKHEAGQLLLALKNLQAKDGSFLFAYMPSGKSPYALDEDRRPAGAIAWVAMALAYYEQKTKSKEFHGTLVKTLSWLQSEMKPWKKSDKKGWAIRFNPADLKSTDWDERQIVALEHNVDALAAFRMASKLNKLATRKYRPVIAELEKFVELMWDEDRKHYWSGMNLATSKINTEEYYLDNQSWTLLALEKHRYDHKEAKLALERSCEHLTVTDGKITGMRDMKPSRAPSSTPDFVWSEGTAGHLLALHQLKMKDCHDVDVDKLHSGLSKMQGEHGGIRYASNSNHPDFSADHSVAGAAWGYFWANRFNPFRP